MKLLLQFFTFLMMVLKIKEHKTNDVIKSLLHLITYKKHVMIFRLILDYSKYYTLTLYQLLSNAQLLIS